MEFGKDYTVRPICAEDITGRFKSGGAAFQPLKSFLKNQALDFQIAHVAQTYAALVLGDDGLYQVIGYLTLTCSEIDLRNGYEIDDCPYANSYDSMPAVKVARLAIDSRYQGQDIGQTFIDLAIATAVEDIAPKVGCRFLVTDSKPEAVGFYEKMGFTFLDTEENRENDNPIMFIDLLHGLEEE